MRVKLLAALCLLIPGGASAQSMNAERFYKRAAALQSKGMLAILSTDELRALVTEAKAAGAKASENRRAAVAARKAPRFCPSGEAVTMDEQEFMTRLSAIPARVRTRINMTEAMTRIFAAKFPCEA